MKMQRYKGHTIETESMKVGTAWSVKVRSVRADGSLAVQGLEIGNAVTFATSALADNAGILLGRAWIDRQS